MSRHVPDTVRCYQTASGKSAQCGTVEEDGRAFNMTRDVMCDGGFRVTAWRRSAERLKPDEHASKPLHPGIYSNGTAEVIRVYENAAKTGATINTGIGGILRAGRYRFKAAFKSQQSGEQADDQPNESHVDTSMGDEIPLESADDGPW